QSLGFDPVLRPAEGPFIAHVERLVAGEETHGVGDVAALASEELHLVVIAPHAVGAAGPAQRFLRDAIGNLVEVDDEPRQFGLVEKAVEKATVLDLVENEPAIGGFALGSGVEELAPENLRRTGHAEAAVGVALFEPGELLL